jgi:Acyl-CoA reductase (LuxC).
MNLVDGKILGTDECESVLYSLNQRILNTLSKGRLDPEIVIAACDKVVANLDETSYIRTMSNLGINETLGKSYITEARQMFSKESLLYRLRTELGENYNKATTFNPIHKEFTVTHKIYPLGVLLHIAAGNTDGLPAFSVLEGLLTGNINILKLPAGEGGISVKLLLEVIKAEPRLAEYIYVFDYSSKDIEHIDRLISAADAVVIWGGKETVTALRSRIPPNIKLIEWGYKISYAYVTEQGMTSENLEGLAKNIAETEQLLCSSLQGVFVDTNDMNVIYAFCERFLPILENEINKNIHNVGIGIKSQIALRLYTEELESIYKNSKLFKGRDCSLIAYPDKTLDIALQFGNAWVRPLPKTELLVTLRPYKNYLQTVGLLCGQSEIEMLTDILFSTGVVRICSGENMSKTYCGAPHDGEFALRRYTKIVTADL